MNRLGVEAGELPIWAARLLPGPDPGVGVGVPLLMEVSITPGRLFRSFSSRLHLARRFENHTCKYRNLHLLTAVASLVEYRTNQD